MSFECVLSNNRISHRFKTKIRLCPIHFARNFFATLSGKKNQKKKKSLKINRSQYHVIDRDNMLQTRNTYDL